MRHCLSPNETLSFIRVLTSALAAAILLFLQASCHAAPTEQLEGEKDYALGNIDGILIRVPSKMLYSGMSSDVNHAWKGDGAERSSYSRPIAVFDLRLPPQELGLTGPAEPSRSLTGDDTIGADISHFDWQGNPDGPANGFRGSLKVADGEPKYWRVADVYGLEHWLRTSAVRQEIRSEIFAGAGRTVYIECKFPDPTPSDLTHANCQQHFNIDDMHVSANLFFSYHWLPQWKQLCDGMSSKVRSFRVQSQKDVKPVGR